MKWIYGSYYITMDYGFLELRNSPKRNWGNGKFPRKIEAVLIQIQKVTFKIASILFILFIPNLLTK
jgi:hypothetical protein